MEPTFQEDGSIDIDIDCTSGQIHTFELLCGGGRGHSSSVDEPDHSAMLPPELLPE